MFTRKSSTEILIFMSPQGWVLTLGQGQNGCIDVNAYNVKKLSSLLPHTWKENWIHDFVDQIF